MTPRIHTYVSKAYPNTIVAPGERLALAGLTFTVVDLGAGGDCDANSIWLLENDNAGSILRWMANLLRFEEPLSKYDTLYVGHGPASDASLIQKQRQYFGTACTEILVATSGSCVLTDDSRKKYEQRMVARYPDYGFTLTVGFSADALARELVGIKNYGLVAPSCRMQSDTPAQRREVTKSRA